jgi:hypothetical protein
MTLQAAVTAAASLDDNIFDSYSVAFRISTTVRIIAATSRGITPSRESRPIRPPTLSRSSLFARSILGRSSTMPRRQSPSCEGVIVELLIIGRRVSASLACKVLDVGSAARSEMYLIGFTAPGLVRKLVPIEGCRSDETNISHIDLPPTLLI